MVTHPTVFVLGAGASMPYGFPSGDTLKKDIISSITGQKNLSTAALAICKHGNIEHDKFVEFRSAFLGSNVNSIDSFLSRRSEYVEIGKYAISVLLCAKENKETFSNLSIEDNWYAALWNALISGVSSVEELKHNKVKIITFNYDRSLEFFLHTSIMCTFGLNEQEAFDELKNFPILHVYGLLGTFTSHSYGVNTANSFFQAANNIKIIPESRDSDPAFTKAQDWLNWAKRICILGFGFDELNVRRLGLKEVIASKDSANGNHHPIVISSTLGMTGAEIDLAQARLGVSSEKWYTWSSKCLNTIREHIYLLN